VASEDLLGVRQRDRALQLQAYQVRELRRKRCDIRRPSLLAHAQVVAADPVRCRLCLDPAAEQRFEQLCGLCVGHDNDGVVRGQGEGVTVARATSAGQFR
jgi:hypothetical protein